VSRNGYRRIYSDKSGRLFVGEPAFGASQPPRDSGDNNMSSALEQFGLDLVDDELGAMDYASLGDYYDFGDDDDYDDFGEMDYASLGEWEEDGEDFGRKRSRRRKPSRRRYIRRGRSRRKRPVSAAKQQVVQKTILLGQTAVLNNAGAGANTVTIRPQFDFVAEDMTFAGSVGAWTITSVQFGDRIVFSNTNGVPIAVFAANNFVRGLVKGAAIAAGLDIQVNGNLAASTTTSQLIATLTGLKRGTTGCGPGAV